MRARGMPARGVQCDLDEVGGRGDGAGGDRDPTDGQMGVAVQREDARHPGQRAGGNRIQCAAGHQLLGGLEQQSHRDRQVRHRRQRGRGAQQDRGMRIVTAGMRHTRHRRRIRQPGLLVHGQSVDVGAQRDPGRAFGSDVARQAGPAGQDLRIESGVDEPFGDEPGGGELLATQFGVAVQMAAPADDVVVVGGQPRLGGLSQLHPGSIAPGVPGPVRLAGCEARRAAGGRCDRRANRSAPTRRRRSAGVGLGRGGRRARNADCADPDGRAARIQCAQRRRPPRRSPLGARGCASGAGAARPHPRLRGIRP